MNYWWMLLLAAALLTVAQASPHALATEVRVARAADCACDYHKGGCTISEAAPAGFKCVCVYKGFWSCSGWAKGCDVGEQCPGGQVNRAACNHGGGDCGGY